MIPYSKKVPVNNYCDDKGMCRQNIVIILTPQYQIIIRATILKSDFSKHSAVLVCDKLSRRDLLIRVLSCSEDECVIPQSRYMIHCNRPLHAIMGCLILNSILIAYILKHYRKQYLHLHSMFSQINKSERRTVAHLSSCCSCRGR